jgi:tetratricopeptide (TPR) repeat protein/ferredoxin
MPCTPKKSSTVSLPVMPSSTGASPRMKRSRMGWKRAVVLGTVQLLIIARILHWYFSGKSETVGPVEPSEAIQTVSDGVITAGAIFFAVALLSTAILGRWFCGWGCHIIMLQDACLWLCRKVGLRPKPFRSRLLLYIPLLLGLYMFIWPLAYRFALVPGTQALSSSLGRDHVIPSAIRSSFGFFNVRIHERPVPRMQTEWELTTSDFWKTFPGWAVGIPFLLVCGFGTVYFLGAKGYCTYGCPYGGLFAPLDTLAIGRIRVNDNCEQCGHCTAACTSNVRVHEEVAEYGMVVDPGCMKCMDCVSVCPNEALSFGIGKPGFLKGAPKTTGVKPNWDLPKSAEIILFVLFWLVFFGVRGVYGAGLFPMLFASGIAAVTTFILWHAWRVLREDNVSFHKWRLKIKKRLLPAGWAYLMIAAVVGLFAAQSLAVQTMNFAAGKLKERVNLSVSRAEVFTPNPRALEPEEARNAEHALRWYDRAAALGDGGIGIYGNSHADIQRGWLRACRQEYAEAERLIRGAMDRANQQFDGLTRDVMMLIVLQARTGEPANSRATIDRAFDYARATLDEQPDFFSLRDQFATLLAQAGRSDEALDVARAGVDLAPDNLALRSRLGQLEANYGDLGRAIEQFRAAIEIDPENIFLRVMLAQSLASSGDLDAGHAAITEAIEHSPNPAMKYNAAMEYARILANTGQVSLAEEWAATATKFASEAGLVVP